MKTVEGPEGQQYPLKMIVNEKSISYYIDDIIELRARRSIRETFPEDFN
jgi:hypothetical protein